MLRTQTTKTLNCKRTVWVNNKHIYGCSIDKHGLGTYTGAGKAASANTLLNCK